MGKRKRSAFSCKSRSQRRPSPRLSASRGPPFTALSRQDGYAHILKGYFYTNLVGTLIDENFAGIEVDIADLDVDELAHAYSRIEEQFEQDLMLHIAAFLDGSEEPFQIGGGKQLRQ